jgi:hypothetical protein
MDKSDIGLGTLLVAGLLVGIILLIKDNTPMEPSLWEIVWNEEGLPETVRISGDE